MSRALSVLLCLALLCVAERSAAQCEGCVPDQGCTVDPPFPTLCPAEPPTATAGVYYETDFTFWMPATFTDPGSGFTVDLLQLTITGVSGLPFGLDLTPSEPSGVYYPQENEFGCARVCGTPLGQGVYTVTISVLAHVSASGIEIDVPQEFSTVITILPGSGGNASFTYDPASGCGSVVTTFQAIIDAAPSPTSYLWDFGNGNTSTDADPPPQSYSEPGIHVVQLTTTIGGYVLNSVTLSGTNDSWCGDVEEPDVPFLGCTGAPDPYFVLTNASGGTVTSSTLDNTTAGAWTNLALLLDNAPYSISFYDEDAVSQDDLLGTYNIPANGAGTYFINVAGGTTGDLQISIEPQQVFTDSDTVLVLGMPDPTLVYDSLTGQICAADTSIGDHTWLLDGVVVSTIDQPCFTVTGPGLWQLVGSNGFGCTDTSNVIVVCPVLEIQQNGNVLFVPSGYVSYAWTLNGDPIGGNDAFVFLQGDGTYALTVDAGNGCILTAGFLHDTSGLNESMGGPAHLAVFPMPCDGAFTLVASGLRSTTATLELVGLTGRVLSEERHSVVAGRLNKRVEPAVPPGAYLLRVRDGDIFHIARVVVR